MNRVERFSDVLNRFIARHHFSIPGLAREAEIVPSTLVKWVRGELKKGPQNWQDIVKVAKVLRLSEAETTELLEAGHHPSVAELWDRVLTEDDKKALSPWPQRTPPFWTDNDLHYFTGRDNEQAVLENMLLQDQRPFICIQGPPGSGKTVLGTHIAHRLRERFPAGVLWIDAVSSDPMATLSDIAEAYGEDVSRFKTLVSRTGAVRDLLATKRALIVIDSVDADQDVTPFLPPLHAPCAVIVITRRQDLFVTRTAHPLSVREFDEQEALLLFAKIIGQQAVDNPEHRKALAALAEYLGYLPIAIAIAAHQIGEEPIWTPAAFLARLQEGEDQLDELLEFGDKSVQSLFEASYRQLPADQQRFFTALSVFPGKDFNAAAAAYVTQTTASQADTYLRSLRRRSLIQHVSPERYQLHSLWRWYNKRKVEALAPLSLRMITYYAQYAQDHSGDFVKLIEENDNIRLALESPEVLEIQPAFIKAVNAMFPFWRARGRYERLEKLLLQARVAAESMKDANSAIATLLNLGQLAGNQGNQQQQLEYLQAGLLQAENLVNEELIAKALGSLGVMAVSQGDYRRAEAYFRRCLDLSRALKHTVFINNTLLVLGVVAEKRGDFAQAEQYLREVEARIREAGILSFLSMILVNLGTTALAQTDYGAAEARFLEALDIASPLDMREVMSGLWFNLGDVALARGDLASAAKNYATSLEIAESIADPGRICETWCGFGNLYRAQGDISQADAAYHKAMALAEEAGIKPVMGDVTFGLAQLALDTGQPDEARAWGEKSAALYANMGHYKSSQVNDWLQSLEEV